MTKGNAYKKNDMGKWVLDYLSKKDFKRIAKRKVRQQARLACKVYA